MEIANISAAHIEISRPLTVPDCNVVPKNKIGSGNGEAKFYFGSKEEMKNFFRDSTTVHCFFLKSDLIKYMMAIQKEYQSPSQNYRGKDELPKLWTERFNEISKLEEIISFDVDLQIQIAGARGYLNASQSRNKGYNLFRELSLPLVSYISIMRLTDSQNKDSYYWRLFVDFDAITQKKLTPLVFTYGTSGATQPQVTPSTVPPSIPESSGCSSRYREGQQQYRERLLNECPFCPITLISDERLLIASHIKPWAVSTPEEQVNPKNGFMFSPLYDKLFDQGFLSFTNEKKMLVSNWLSKRTQELCNIRADVFVQALPLDDERRQFLDYHRDFIFKG